MKHQKLTPYQIENLGLDKSKNWLVTSKEFSVSYFDGVRSVIVTFLPENAKSKAEQILYVYPLLGEYYELGKICDEKLSFYEIAISIIKTLRTLLLDQPQNEGE